MPAAHVVGDGDEVSRRCAHMGNHRGTSCMYTLFYLIVIVTSTDVISRSKVLCLQNAIAFPTKAS
jgi:hypothetical protein